MGAPVVNSITFDKTAYNPGETITATVDYTPGTSETAFTFTGVVKDTVSGQEGQGTGSFNVQVTDLCDASGSDTGSRVWTVESDDHTGAAVLTATA